MRNPSKIISFSLKRYKELSKFSWASPRILCGYGEVKIISENSGNSNYPILCDNGKYYSLTGKSISGQNLLIYYYRKCPIENGRLVSGYTFAVRFKNFLEEIKVNDPSSEEELDYFKNIAKELLDWQIDTAEEDNELNYLRSLGLKK